MIQKLIESNMHYLLLALPISVAANNFLGAALAEIDINQTFEKERLKKGLLKGTFVYLSILMYTFISIILDDMTFELLGGSYTLVDAMYIIILAAIAMYVKDGMDKLAKIMKYNENESYQNFDEEE